jgi:hypothetical protein
MKIPKSLSNLITNKYVLYLVAGLAFLNLFWFMFSGHLNAVIFFILVGYIMTFFSKNMVIVLSIPLIFTNILITGMHFKENLENMASNTEPSVETSTTNSGANAEPNASKAPAKKPNTSTSTTTSTGHGDIPITPPLDHPTNDESFEGRQPLEYSDIKKKGKNTGTRLDHGATVEQAYDTLNKIIGGPGFTKMTEDTKRLMEQQQKLAQSMEQFGPMLDSIQPFLEKAQGLLQNVDMAGINDMINKTKQQQ